MATIVRVGFVINPIAGMGGKVGLKGTDGDYYRIAAKMGALPVAHERAMMALRAVVSADLTHSFLFLTAAAPMGADVLSSFENVKYEVVYTPKTQKIGATTANDTMSAVTEFLKQNVSLIIFCGGDGTARDVCSVVKNRVPVIGVPAGVKMFSSVFLIRPENLVDVLEKLSSQDCATAYAEVLDIDEGLYRAGQLNIKLYCNALTIDTEKTQNAKGMFYGGGSEAVGIASYIRDRRVFDCVYILGPGSTLMAVKEALGLKTPTPLGVDVIYKDKIWHDVNEKDILKILNKTSKSVIIVSPLGSQGFIFGRGNQQISSRVIKKVGVENIVVVATESKLKKTKRLYVDTGDRALDKKFGKYIRVLSSYAKYVLMPLQ